MKLQKFIKFRLSNNFNRIYGKGIKELKHKVQTLIPITNFAEVLFNQKGFRNIII